MGVLQKRLMAGRVRQTGLASVQWAGRLDRLLADRLEYEVHSLSYVTESFEKNNTTWVKF